MRTDEFTVVVLMVLAIGIPIGIYGLVVRNDLARRWERLRALAANVRSTRERRQGLGQDVAKHVGHAQRHEQRVTQHGARRGRGGGRLVKIADNGNGWPSAGTTSVTAQAMSADTQSRDAEAAARVALHAEAEAYNAIVRSWPSCIVAQSCGFRPWQYQQHRGGRWGRA